MRASQIDLSDLKLPIVLRPRVRPSDAELIRFSEANRPLRIERNKEGEITVMTPVGGRGSTHEMIVASQLFNWTEKDGTGIAFSPSGGFNLPDGSCLSPDASWIALDLWNGLTQDEQDGYPPLCPDFLIEVRSKTDSRRIMEAKMQIWLDNGAKLAWLVDPVEGTVTVYHPGIAIETLARPERVLAAAPVAGFELLCARLWSPR